MKYWRGYLVALITAALTWALMEFAKSHTTLVDMFYPYVTRLIQTALAEWSGGMAACLWQIIAVALILVALATAVLMVVLRWNPIQWFGWILAGASCLFFLHTGIYGLNTYAGPLSEDVHLESSAYNITEKELVEATVYFRDKANALSTQVHREKDQVVFAEFEVLAERAGAGFENLTYKQYESVFAGSTLPVKKLGWADMYTSMGITGVTMPLTGEAAVNPQIPDVSLPFTMCHEMAHRMCIAVESDANFAAFLACEANEDLEFQYSAYFMAFRYCYNSLVAIGTSSASSSANAIMNGVSPTLKQDLEDYRDFFAAKQNDKATAVATKVNDTYIKTSGDENGVKSYGMVTDMLVCWYIDEIILPTQVVEEDPFDPYDPNEVDLSGIVNAPEKEETEPAA